MIEQIAPREFSDWASRQGHDRPVLMLDVREPWEWQTASVRADGFELLQIPMGAVPARLNELDAERPIACLCHHGGRSQQVARFLEARGFRRLANVAGGIHAWSAQADPTVPVY